MFLHSFGSNCSVHMRSEIFSFSRLFINCIESRANHFSNCFIVIGISGVIIQIFMAFSTMQHCRGGNIWSFNSQGGCGSLGIENERTLSVFSVLLSHLFFPVCVPRSFRVMLLYIPMVFRCRFARPHCTCFHESLFPRRFENANI